MKKLIFLTLVILICISEVYSQTPGMPYQAVLLNKEGGQELPGYDADYANPLRNTLVSIRFSIHDLNGLEFSEIHNDVVVDGYGMINLIVGMGTYTFSDFYEMDWDGKEKWLKVEVDFDNGSNFENLDYLSLHRIPDPDNQKIYLSGDSLLIENGGGVDLSSLLASAGNDNQTLTLVGNIIYLENGGSIDLHGNDATANSGVLDLVAGDAASGTNGAIKLWTNTDGSTQQTSAVLTGAGNFGIGANITPSQRLDVDGQARVRTLNAGVAADELVVADATGVLKKRSLSDVVQEPWFGTDDDAAATSNTEDIYHMADDIGIGIADPVNRLDISNNGRSGTHASDRPLYVTGTIGDDDTGIEFRHTNGTQGIGFGFNSIYGAGSNASQHINLMPKGTTGYVGLGTVSPSYPFHVVKPFTNNWQARFQNGTSNTFLSHGSGYGMHINTGVTNTTTTYALDVRNSSQDGMLYVRNDGNVGMGTNAPTQRLDVNGQARVRTLNAGVAADEVVVADANGVLRKRSAAAISQEPWFGDDDDAAATTNTEDIYHMGQVGIGINDPGTSRLYVNGGNIIWANGVHRIDHSTPSGETGLVFNANNAGNRSRFDIRNVDNGTVGNRYFGLTYNGETGLFIRKGGNVGVRRTDPTYSLDVNGSFRNQGHGLFTVMNGADGNMTGTIKRGIFMWNDTDDKWGMYMSRPGAGRSMSGGTAVAGVGFNSYSIRHRVQDHAGVGFIFENSNEDLLMSLRGSDGYAYFNDQVRVNELTAGAATDEVVVADANGVLRKRSAAAISQEPWFGDDDDAAATTNTEDIYHLGQVGIGTTNPDAKLEVSTSGETKLRITAGAENQDAILEFNTSIGQDPTAANYAVKNAIISDGLGTWKRADMRFVLNNEANNNDYNIANDTRMIIKPNGNVGIAVTNPTTRLHVLNTSAMSGTYTGVSPILRLQRQGTGGSKYTTNAEFRLGTYEGVISARTRLDITMGLGNTNHVDRTPMTIRADGRVGINERHTPAYNLDVNGSFRNIGHGLFTVMNGADGNMTGTIKRGIFMWNDNDSNWGIYMSRSGAGRALDVGTAVAGVGFNQHAIRFRVNNTTTQGFIFENAADQNLFSLRGSDGFAYFRGNIRIDGLGAGDVQSDANGNLSVSSDERLKNISGNFTKGLDAVMGLQPINFRWNNVSNMETENSYTGFSAQNVKSVIPEAVSTDDRGYFTLADRPIIGALVNSVKELKSQNDRLEIENQTLKETLHDVLQRLENLEKE
ncbi:MAG: tail fiber domain-containing protein [Flavobacteriales bacterium]|nr:tail fiber domain-containing protein [Flavobacteriales bacterium]